uniref:H/ACA ribonucleoprotein complex non-core subunit NAF1 n=2 Tax=Spongospora subterranea TaxID=70186 RepID=A0A0H5RAG2_9EUKA|eukprot:CRZ11063.1 hypothetical protein [Spongospora subterranea]
MALSAANIPETEQCSLVPGRISSSESHIANEDTGDLGFAEVSCHETGDDAADVVCSSSIGVDTNNDDATGDRAADGVCVDAHIITDIQTIISSATGGCEGTASAPIGAGDTICDVIEYDGQALLFHDHAVDVAIAPRIDSEHEPVNFLESAQDVIHGDESGSATNTMEDDRSDMLLEPIQETILICSDDMSAEAATDANASAMLAEFEVDSDPCLDEDSESDLSDDDAEEVIDRADLDRFIADSFKVVDEIPRTLNEMDPALIEIPDRLSLVVPPDAKIHAAGTIMSHVEGTMVIKALKGVGVIDIGGAVILSDRTPLGWIDDIIGPVEEPFYLVRLRDDHGIPPEIIIPSTIVFAVSELYQLLEQSNLDRKGTDASHLNDEENPKIVEYSDDEEERNAKKKPEKAKKHKSSGDGPSRRCEQMAAPSISTNFARMPLDNRRIQDARGYAHVPPPRQPLYYRPHSSPSDLSHPQMPPQGYSNGSEYPPFYNDDFRR